MKKLEPVEHTRRWISSIVIGLNLCPFADRVFKAGKIRYVATETSDPTELIKELATELMTLFASPRDAVETTLLIHPEALEDFADYGDFLEVAEALVEDLKLKGIVQLVGFHPEYQFQDTAKDAVENYTNRSPYPMIHLLREESISELAALPVDLLEIPQRNIQTLKSLGSKELFKRLQAITFSQ